MAEDFTSSSKKFDKSQFHSDAAIPLGDTEALNKILRDRIQFYNNESIEYSHRILLFYSVFIW